MTWRQWAGWTMGLALAAGGVAWLLSGDEEGAPGNAPGFSVTGVLAGEDGAEGYARVTGPEPLDFPRDHGAHPGYRHEWWYLTGNLRDADGRHFGYQVTFFRFNVDPDAPSRASGLASNQVWMAHLAITDTAGERFYHAERLSRGGGGLAGAESDPFSIWLDDWRLESADRDTFMPLGLRADDGDIALSLNLEAEKPLVLQGDRGYSRKGPEPGNASRYFSFTRIATEGYLRLGDREFAVSGSSWMDREWGTSTLSEEQTGWDWFSIQLDNGRDIMFYHLRREDGSVDPLSKGLLVEADGETRLLALEEVELQASRHWDSPLGDARYPVAWRMRIPGEDLELDLEARLDDQELRTGFRYWEGAIAIRGEQGGSPVRGVGYAELTGYAGP